MQKVNLLLYVKFNSFLPVKTQKFLKVKKSERFVFSQASCPLQGILATAKKSFNLQY